MLLTTRALELSAGDWFVGAVAAIGVLVLIVPGKWLGWLSRGSRRIF